jgi:peptidoglycan/LPS O-acetylase OafA/YrhL
LFFLYLLNPLWQVVFSQKDDGKLAKYLTTVALLFSLVMAVVEYPSGKIGMLFTGGTYWLGYVFFYLYGGLVKEKLVKFGNQMHNLLLLSTGLILAILGDYLAVYAQINDINFIWNTYTSNYLSVPVIMMSVGLFNLLVSFDSSKLAPISKVITKLANLSFGVYLIHGYFILLSRQVIGFKFDLVGMNVYLYNIVDVGSILILSTVTTWLWLKIPKLKALLGG